MDDYTDNTTSAEQQSQLKLLIARGKEQGYLTYAEVNDHLPNDIVDPDQIEDIIAMINGMGIQVHEVAPDVESLLLAGEASGNRHAHLSHRGFRTAGQRRRPVALSRCGRHPSRHRTAPAGCAYP